ncbi:MAG: cytidine deaminase [Oscillospiraceae bacterium]|nr:cytidine deaminase [Oscillospiraceae bacterium]
MTREELVALAAEARRRAYAPYSHFLVGAALLTKDGRVYTGCNIENAAYSATVCAERTALFQAVCAGERNFASIAVVGGLEGQKPGFAPPCGVCRQVMAEFCDADFLIYLWDGARCETHTLGQLLPVGFSADSLKGEAT